MTKKPIKNVLRTYEEINPTIKPSGTLYATVFEHLVASGQFKQTNKLLELAQLRVVNLHHSPFFDLVQAD